MAMEQQATRLAEPDVEESATRRLSDTQFRMTAGEPHDEKVIEQSLPAPDSRTIATGGMATGGSATGGLATVGGDYHHFLGGDTSGALSSRFDGKSLEARSDQEPSKSLQSIAGSSEGRMPQPDPAPATKHIKEAITTEVEGVRPTQVLIKTFSSPSARGNALTSREETTRFRETGKVPVGDLPAASLSPLLLRKPGVTTPDLEKGANLRPGQQPVQSTVKHSKRSSVKGATQESEDTQPKVSGEGKDKDGARRKLAKKILQPMGLWVNTRKLIDDEDLANGFPRVTSFIASDPDGLTSIYRRFDKLNVRNLLLLEAKVAALQALQETFDIEDADDLKGDGQNNFAMSTTHSSFEYFALLGEGKDVIEADDHKSQGEEENGVKKAAKLESGDDGGIAREASQLGSLCEPVDARKADGVHLTNNGHITNISIATGTSSERVGKSGIPACAFRKWDESREDVLRVVRGKIEGANPGLNDEERQALIQASTEKDRRYWQDRWEVAQAIQHALKEYQEAVILHNKMLKLQYPTEGTVEALRKYVRGARIKDATGQLQTTIIDEKTQEERNLRPPQFLKTSAAEEMLKGKDFISLHPPGDDDLGTWLAAKWFGWLLKRQGATNPEFDDVSEVAVGRFTTVWTFFVAIGFLMGAVWFIWRIGLEEVNVEVKFERKLAILTAFTALFGGWIALFTSAKRYEIFGATAAYAAVLIVFVGVDPGDAIGP